MQAYVHYTATFKGTKMRFHGETFIDRVKQVDISRETNKIVSKVKDVLIGKMKDWGFVPKDLIAFEIYYFDNGKEINIFSFGLQQGA